MQAESLAFFPTFACSRTLPLASQDGGKIVAGERNTWSLIGAENVDKRPKPMAYCLKAGFRASTLLDES
jgi:hypothetical protein